MLISAKTLGSRKRLFEDFSIAWPPNDRSDDGGDGDLTLRDIIERIVRHEVQAFRQRQTDRQFIRVLSQEDIDTAAAKGKVEMGGSEIGRQHVNEEHAVANAWTAFEDGLYLVVIDDVQYSSLDQTVFLTEDSRLTFIRLAMLSGG